MNNLYKKVIDKYLDDSNFDENNIFNLSKPIQEIWHTMM